MEFLKNFDLNFICRVFECCAIFVFCLGTIVTLAFGLGLVPGTEFNILILLGGLIGSFLNAVPLLFFSRIGDAIDDIRNKYVYSDLESEEEL